MQKVGTFARKDMNNIILYTCVVILMVIDSFFFFVSVVGSKLSFKIICRLDGFSW